MKLLAKTLALVLGIASPGLFAADAAEAEAQCAQWAKEDGVQKDEMAQYMADCVADQMTQAESQTAMEDNAPKD
jgi:hypothetical protein